MAEEPSRIVARGYDALADRYAAWSAAIVRDPRGRMLDAFMTRLAPGAEVVDLGCGDGLPSTKALASRYRVTGIDVSGVQLAAARRNVPDATFLQADLGELDMPPASCDGVTAFYSISHLPRATHAGLLGRIAGWLRPGGLLLATLGATDGPDWVGEWLGVEMFFSSFDAATNRGLLHAAGFELLVDEVADTVEPEGPVPFLWVLGRRRATVHAQIRSTLEA